MFSWNIKESLLNSVDMVKHGIVITSLTIFDLVATFHAIGSLESFDCKFTSKQHGDMSMMVAMWAKGYNLDRGDSSNDSVGGVSGHCG